MAQRHSRNIPRGLLVAVAAGVVVLGTGLVLRSRWTDSSSGTSPSGSASGETSLEALLAASATPEQFDPSQPKGQILGKTSLADAIAVATPLMTNTASRLDPGSALLSLWAAEHLTWNALEALPETSPALFRKDPDAERGKRFCITGSIVEIRAEKTLAGRLTEDRALPLIERPAAGSAGMAGSESPPLPADSSGPPLLAAPLLPDSMGVGGDWTIAGGGKVYVATIKEKPEPSAEPAGHETRRAPPKDPLVVEIIAVKSTGSLVDGSDARACGVLTGVTLAAPGGSSALTDVTMHRIVGMFDLPENHITGEMAHHGG
jgi:hypothetical protein